MTDSLDELTFDVEEEGQLVRKQLHKAILGEGAWPTVMFMYQELDAKTGAYRAPKVALVRFKKAHGVYRKHSSFNVSSAAQARQIAELLARWYGDLPAADDTLDDESNG